MFPAARSGITGAVILGLGRALGETMAVTMVIGNRAEISASLFAPSYTMASVIANEFTEATGDLYLAALAEIGLLLFVVDAHAQRPRAPPRLARGPSCAGMASGAIDARSVHPTKLTDWLVRGGMCVGDGDRGRALW